jgi:hypothetical protein
MDGVKARAVTQRHECRDCMHIADIATSARSPNECCNCWRRAAPRHSTELPVAIVAGASGAGYHPDAAVVIMVMVVIAVIMPVVSIPSALDNYDCGGRRYGGKQDSNKEHQDDEEAGPMFSHCFRMRMKSRLVNSKDILALWKPLDRRCSAPLRFAGRVRRRASAGSQMSAALIEIELADSGIDLLGLQQVKPKQETPCTSFQNLDMRPV